MFKNQHQDGEDFKKKRQQFSQNLRKANRQQKFIKRRNVLSTNIPVQQNVQTAQNKKQKLLIVDNRFTVQITKFLSSSYTMQNFNQLLQSINSQDILRQHYGLIGIRKILSIAQNPPIQPIIDSGLVPKMIQYIKQSSYPQLQLEATWALTNVASGTSLQCQSIIDKGGIPLFVGLLRSQNLGTVEQAIWAVGNIASDSVYHRNSLIASQGVENLVRVIQANMMQENIVKHGAWALSNLCRGTPLPKYENVKLAIPLLCYLIAQDKINDKEITADSCWAISYHCDNKKNKIQTLIQAKIIPKIVSFLSDSYLSLVVPSVRILGNVSTGTTAQTDEIIKSGGLDQLYVALQNPKKVVRREACWVISNITAGVKYQAQQVLCNQKLLQRLFKMFQQDSNDIKRQICYIFSNFTHSIQPQVIFTFYKSSSIVSLYYNLLSCDDAKAIEISLECLFIILGVGEKIKGSQRNPLVADLYSINAIDQLEKLQYHDSDAVYGNVSKLLQTYFQIQDPLDL